METKSETQLLLYILGLNLLRAITNIIQTDIIYIFDRIIKTGYGKYKEKEKQKREKKIERDRKIYFIPGLNPPRINRRLYKLMEVTSINVRANVE